MSPMFFVCSIIICIVLCTTVMRIVSNGKINFHEQCEDSGGVLGVLYSMMLMLCYIIIISLGIFVILKNFLVFLVFLSFVLLWKSLDIKEYCLNSIVSYIKEKLEE